MAVLRPNQLPTAARAFSMQDVEAAAKSVLLKAKLRAEQLIAAAMDEAEAMKAAAVEEGRREGFEQGHAEGVKHGAEAGRQQALQQHSGELTSVLTVLTQIATELDAGRRDLEAQALGEVVALAAAVARRVTKRQGLIDVGVLEANLADSMKLAVSAADLRVAVHPEQLADLKAVLPKLRLQWPNLKHVELVEDGSLAAGGCRVYTGSGSIDASLDAQLDRVIAELLPTPTTEG